MLRRRPPPSGAAVRSVLIDRRVADPRWLVRHMLQYGPDAEVVEPEAYRGIVREVVEGMAG